MGKFKLQVKELAKKRGITQLYKHLIDRGVSIHHATELKQGRLKRLDLELLLRLCIIFKCPINELIVFEAENENELKFWPFFGNMLAGEENIDLNKKVNALDSEKLKRLEEFLREM